MHMNKKLITAGTAVAIMLSTMLITVEAKAETQAPTVAVLDTALDTSLPIFKDKIVYEVCILEWASCPNGQKFMEGPGSSVLPSKIISSRGFDHGTQMASVAVATNPNIKIVFIRIIGNTPSGLRQATGETGVSLALKWVLDNKSRFNIQSVAMSQANHSILTRLTDYCPATPTLRGAISSLVSSGTPVFFAAGNMRDLSRLSWPACINDSISIGMADQYGQIDNYSNFDKDRLDFYALGNMKVAVPGGSVKNAAGSSISAQVAAATWAGIKYSNPSLTYQQVLDIFNNNSKPIRGARGQYGKLISSNPSVIAPSAPTVSKPVAPVIKTAEQLAAEAKAALVVQANKAIADAELAYQAEIKLAADKLAAIKLEWAKKING
jgi:hypothetical protein